ncbi:MAG: serine/threonine-protein kinase [Syntrophomonas sp.]
MIRCPVCTSDNPDDQKYCGECGVNLMESLTGRLSQDSLLEDRYRIIKTIGRGGMGAVYLALDQRLNNMRVAVKEMSTKAVGEGNLDSAIYSFKKEAALLIHLRHAALPRVIDFFPRGTDRWYLVMDFIEGKNLASVLAERGPVGEAEVMLWTRQLCEILDFLHSQNPPIIFRDLKPSNIMLTPQGQIKLVDFGIARHFRPGVGPDTAAYGSTGFAPPEQYGDHQTNVRSDVYALGATIHNLLTGIDPQSSPFFFEEPKNHATVSPELNDAIMKALEFRSELRPESVCHFWTLATSEDWASHPVYGGNIVPAEIRVLDQPVQEELPGQKELKEALAAALAEQIEVVLPISGPLEKVPEQSGTKDFEDEPSKQLPNIESVASIEPVVPEASLGDKKSPAKDSPIITVADVAPELQPLAGAVGEQEINAATGQNESGTAALYVEAKEDPENATSTLPIANFVGADTQSITANDALNIPDSAGTMVLDGIDAAPIPPPPSPPAPSQEHRKAEPVKSKAKESTGLGKRPKQAANPPTVKSKSGKWVKFVVAAALVITVSSGIYISLNKKTAVPNLPSQVETVNQDSSQTSTPTSEPVVQEQKTEEVQKNPETSNENTNQDSSSSSSSSTSKSRNNSSGSSSSGGSGSSSGSSQPKGETYDYRI